MIPNCSFLCIMFSKKIFLNGSFFVSFQVEIKKNCCPIWQYGLWGFSKRDTKLERFLPKNQHTQKEIIEFRVSD